MTSFLLVHGAWHDAQCWELLSSVLRERGHAVSTPTLPAHGSDPASPYFVTMKSYGRRVCEAAEKLLMETGEKSVVVGHSMGGMVISQAAEIRPDLFERLIFLTGFVADGENGLGTLAAEDTQSDLLNSFRLNGLRGTHSIIPERARPLFYDDCTDEQVALAISGLCPQPIRPQFSKVRISAARFGSVPKSYIVCTLDQTITPDFQRRIAAKAGIEDVKDLAASHSPFLSMPGATADTLIELAR